MTKQELDAIEARAHAATGAPWSVDTITEDIEPYGDEDTVISRGIDGPNGVGLNTGVEYQMYSPGDAAFIAHARQDIPALIAEVWRLKDIIDPLGLHDHND